MDDDQLGFLSEQSGGSEDTRAPEAASAPELPVEPVVSGPERGADGKFVSRQAAETAPAAPPPPQPAPTPPEPGHVPISAMLDEREKRQAAERRLADLEAQRQPPPPLEPTQALEQALYVQNLKVSRKFAERQYGPETIATVHDWAARRCDEDPHFNAQMRAADDPYEAATQAYNRDQIVAKVSPERLAAFEAWEAAQAAAQAQAPNPSHNPCPSTVAPAPPRSLANAPGNGAAGQPYIPVGPGEAFRAAIPK